MDDFFSIWYHGEKEFQLFFENLTIAHPTITFTVEWPRDSIHFLDMYDPEIWDLFYKKTTSMIAPIEP